jgi:hypothetical protein
MLDPASVTHASTKKAAIQWLLAYGEVNTRSRYTESALAEVEHRGVDYERSDMPQHLLVEIENVEIGKVGERIGMLSATIVFADAPHRERNWYAEDDTVTFVMPRAAMDHYVMASAIGATTSDFTSIWRQRMDTRHYDRLVAATERENARVQARQDAIAAHGQGQESQA